MLSKSVSKFLAAILLSGLLVAVESVQGQVSITSGSPVTQNFDGIGTSGTATIPSGFKIGRNTATYVTAGTATELAAGTTGTGVLNGTSSGGAYNFANGITASSTDRSLGFLTTGTATGPGYLYMQLQNNTGVLITDLTINFDYEKYRSGTRAFDLTFQTSTDGTTFGGAIAAGGQSYAADANNTTISNPPTTTGKSVSLLAVNIANGAFYYLRWQYAPNTGTTYTNAQAIGIDNISVTATIGCSGTPSHATASGTPSAVCSGSSTNLSITGFSTGLGITYQWQSSATGIAGSYTNISGATNTTYTSGALTSTTYYRCYTRCVNSGLADTSSVKIITINPLPNPSISGGATIFTGNSANLIFTGVASDVVYYWNGASTLNTTISGSGSSTVVVTPTVTTTYSVTSATSALGCTSTISGRATYITVMNPSDTIPNRGNNMGLGNPSNATSNVTDSNNFLMVKSQYALSYNNSKGMANWVSWHLSRAWKGASTRCNCFTQDATLPAGYFKATTTDYTGTGFDRGHLCPSDDRDGSDSDNNATFKMTNMSPQSPVLNEQIWGDLEDYCRKLLNKGNELYIVTGGYGTGGNGSNGGTTNSIATGKINVPSHFWKVIIVLPVGINDSARVHSNTRVIAVDMPNVQTVNAHTWDYYRVCIDTIEARTGYNFFASVPDSVENIIEAKVDDGSAGIAYWDFTNTNNIATFGATVKSDKLDTSLALAYNTLTRGATAPSSTGANCFRTTGFKNEGVSTSNTDYYQVKLKARSGYKLSVIGIDARFSGTNTYYAAPGVTSQYAYSTNGTTFTMIGSPVTSSILLPSTVDCSGIGAMQNLADTTTLYIRYYASGQTTTGGWGFFSSDTGVCGLIINGSLVATGARPAINSNNAPLTLNEGIELNIAPNPFTGDLKLSYKSATDQPLTLNIYNLAGTLVYTRTLELATDDIYLQLNNILAGNYILSLQSDNARVVRKIVKQ